MSRHGCWKSVKTNRDDLESFIIIIFLFNEVSICDNKMTSSSFWLNQKDLVWIKRCVLLIMLMDTENNNQSLSVAKNKHLILMADD